MKLNIRNNQIKYTEVALISFVWLVLLLTPIMFREDNNNPLVRSVMNQLEILIPLSIMFLVNRYVLVPRLLFKGKPLFFIASVLGVILLLAIASYIYDEQIKKYPPAAQEPQREESLRPGEDRPPAGEERPGKPRRPQSRQPRPVPPFANFLVLSVLVVGFDTGLRSGLRWIKAEDEKVRLEKESVSTQLTLLNENVTRLLQHYR